MINLKQFKIISIAEGVSFLLILLVTMPLKYIFKIPEPNQYIGYIHGVLFIVYVIGAFIMYERFNWSAKTLFIVLLCSILPFGPFYVDRKILPSEDIKEEF